jgi:hypothetical protein
VVIKRKPAKDIKRKDWYRGFDLRTRDEKIHTDHGACNDMMSLW